MVRAASVIELDAENETAGEEAPLISGQLRAFPLTNILQFLGGTGATGALTASYRDRRAFIVLEEGKIVAVSNARLPRPSKKKKRGAVDREAEEAELLDKVCEVVARVEAWSQGQFSFTPTQDRPYIVDSDDRPMLTAERVAMHMAFCLDEELRPEVTG